MAFELLGRCAQWMRKGRMLLRRERYRRELAEEMAFHQDEAQRALEADGMSSHEARRAARVEFGNAQRLREESQRQVGFRWESLWQDVRYAVRQMGRAPGFTLAVVGTLTLGIGATTAIFSVVEATLLRPLPYPEAERIVSVRDEKIAGISTGGLVGVPRFYDLAARSRSFQALSFFYFEDATLVVGSRVPEQLDSVGTNAGFWRVFGVQPMLGRVFDANDDRPGMPGSVVLSYAAWQRIFGGDAAVIGRMVTIDKQSAMVLGVMPKEFDYPAKTEVWRAAQFDPGSWKSYRGDGTRFVNVFGLLRDGSTLAAAQGELAAIGSQLGAEHSDTDGQWRFASSSLRDYTYGKLKPALEILLAAAFLLLVIGCVNVANLLLSRASAREREVALRQALGASRGRVVRQLLTESVLLALAGGVVGLGAAIGLVQWSASRLPAIFYTHGGRMHGAVSVAWPVAGFALAVSLLAGIAFGMAPVLMMRRGFMRHGGMPSDDLQSRLKTGEARAGGAAGNGLRSVFIAVQVGLSLMLLVGASLLTESLWKLMHSPLGFQPDHLLVFKAELPWEGKVAPVDAFFTEAERRIEALPGVVSAGQITALPTVNWHSRSNYDADWLPRTTQMDAVRAENRHIFGHYLETMRIPLLAGRELRADDGAAVLVNEEFVRQYAPGQSVVGRFLLNAQSLKQTPGQASGARQQGIQIVGVIGNVRGTAGSIASEVLPEIYYPAAGLTTRWFVVRSPMEPGALSEVIRKTIRGLDPQQSIGSVGTMADRLDAAVAQPKLNMALVAAFAGIALMLSSVGIYGVVAYSVAQKRQEIGVRMALGARRGQISLLFLRRVGSAALIGLAGGVGAALLLTRLLRSELYGVEPDSPAAFATAVVLLALPVLIASLRPAMRAAAMNPVDALRVE